MSNIVSRQLLNSVLMPVIRSSGGHYKKTSFVHVRPATSGERVTTITSSGRETKNTAKKGDFLVKNITMAQEKYIVSGETLNQRYKFHRQIDEKWAEYLPVGEILALIVDSDIANMLGQKSSFAIESPWDDTQPVRIGDYLASPLPKLDEIYRIDRREFLATYKKIEK